MSFQPLQAKVLVVTAQEVRLERVDGSVFVVPTSIFELPPVVGDRVAILGLPLGTEAAGMSRFAASILNELLSNQS
jgi:hypothetical protein